MGLINQLVLFTAGPVVTTLSVGITSTSTSFTLVLATSFPAGSFAVQIGGEVIYVGTRTGLVCTNLKRGDNGTTAAAHLAGDAISLYATPTVTDHVYPAGAPGTPGEAGTIGDPLVGGTPGSILFVGAGSLMAQDNAQLFWDDTNNFLGLGTLAPLYPIDIHTTTGGSSQLHISADSLDRGGYLTAYPGVTPTFLISTGQFDGPLLQWRAKGDAAAIINLAGSNFDFYGDAGLVEGNVYTPTHLMALGSGGALSLKHATGGGLIEYNRVNRQGTFVGEAFVAGSFTSDAGSWTVIAGDVVFNGYAYVGKMIIWTLGLSANTDIVGAPTALYVLLPGGLTCAGVAGSFAMKPAYVYDNAVILSDVVVQVHDATHIAIHRGGMPFVAGLFAVYFTLWIGIN